METVLRRLAVQAGEAIMEVYGRSDLGTRAKADDSPVTEADLAADQIIVAGLEAAFPDIPVVTEERAESHLAATGAHFLVDPLDGTKEFINRRSDFTVNIALIEDGAPTVGVVFAPALGRLLRTDSLGGAVEETAPFDTGGAVRLLRLAAPDPAMLRVVASKSHRDAATDAYIARYPVGAFRSAGSSLKFCLIAGGEADFYPRLGPTMEWDTAAGDAILRALGGHVVCADTLTPLRYGKAGRRNPHFLAYAPGVTPQPVA